MPMKAKTAKALLAIFLLLNMAYFFDGLNTAEYEKPITSYDTFIMSDDADYSAYKMPKPVCTGWLAVLSSYKWQIFFVVIALMDSQVCRARTTPKNWHINIRSPNAALQGGFLFWRNCDGSQDTKKRQDIFLYL